MDGSCRFSLQILERVVESTHFEAPNSCYMLVWWSLHPRHKGWFMVVHHPIFLRVLWTCCVPMEHVIACWKPQQVNMLFACTLQCLFESITNELWKPDEETICLEISQQVPCNTWVNIIEAWWRLRRFGTCRDRPRGFSSHPILITTWSASPNNTDEIKFVAFKWGFP